MCRVPCTCRSAYDPYGRDRRGPTRTTSPGSFMASMAHVLARDPAIFLEAVAHTCVLEVRGIHASGCRTMVLNTRTYTHTHLHVHMH